MKEVGALGLEVDALSGRVGCDQDACRVIGIVEGKLHFLAPFLVHPSVKLEEALFGFVGAEYGLDWWRR